jgi:hypothetical protein
MPSKELWKASKVFAPDFPRNCADGERIQATRTDRAEFVAALDAASEFGNPGYYSVYSFPRGHPKQGCLPKIDCIFIDLDVATHHYQPNPKKPGYDTSFESWRADMSALLARSRMIAEAILDAGKAEHFRVVLSGHKGIHLYLDFPPVDPENGSFGQFKNGLALYGQQVMEWLDNLAGGVNIDPWVDVDASDLARLGRHPNTPHYGAKYDDVQRWCVPATIEELASMDVDSYLELTEGPRWTAGKFDRVPSQSAHDKLVQKIRTASASDRSSPGSRKRKGTRRALKEYKENQQNDEITLEDVLFLTSNKPCIKAFRDREDAYDYGNASRTMELSIMGRLIDMQVPIDVMHQFFEPIPGYDENFTEHLVGDLLARGNEYGQFNCVTICGGVDENGSSVAPKAPQFCLGDDCSIYRRSDDLKKPSDRYSRPVTSE